MEELLTHSLLDFIDNSPSMFHAAQSCIELLESKDFRFLDPSSKWNITEGGKYYTKVNESAVIAFYVHSVDIEKDGFKIIGTHCDVPGFKIKPNPQIYSDPYIKLNTEVYGGPILNTWFDRPLSIAGRVSIKSDNILKPQTKLVAIDKPLLIIPNLAIHMNKEVNKGIALDPQKDTLPLLAYCDENLDNHMLLTLIAQTLNVKKEEILDLDLYLYPYEKGLFVGIHEEFISAPRLDNLSMVYSSLYALMHASSSKGISLFVCFDNEEIGSHTKQGADSLFLSNTLERICLALNKSREDFFIALSESFLISADVAHLTHPNYIEKHDVTNKVFPGKGPAIKTSANSSYTTDSDSYAVLSALCKKENLPYQVFANRSGEKGGSTIGPICSSLLSIRSIDVGIPILGMHSLRELMAKDDFITTCKLFETFYSLS